MTIPTAPGIPAVCAGCGATLYPGWNLINQTPSGHFHCDGCWAPGDVQCAPPALICPTCELPITYLHDVILDIDTGHVHLHGCISSRIRGAQPMTTITLPDYIDPAVLRPGQTVRCVVDDVDTVLTVVKVEPALICRRPDGTGVIVLAHTVVPVDD